MPIGIRKIIQKRSIRLGLIIFGGIVLLLSCLAFVQKQRLDSAAETYLSSVDTYIAQLGNDDATIASTYGAYPKLDAMPLGFLSGTYQRASRVDATIQHSTTYLKNIFERSVPKKGSFAADMYVINSYFHGARINAYSTAVQKTAINLPSDQLADVRAEMLRGYAMGADKFLAELDARTDYHEVYVAQLGRLKTALKDYSAVCRDVASKLVTHPADSEEAFVAANYQLVQHLADIEKYGNFIMTYPLGIQAVDVPQIVTTSLKKSVADAENMSSAQAAELYAELTIKTAIAKALMPTSYADVDYRVKADNIRVLIEEMQTKLVGVQIAKDTTENIDARLRGAALTMTLYDDAANADEYSGGFIRRVQAQIQAPLGDLQSNPADVYGPVLAKLKKIEPPAYVKNEYQQILNSYAAAIPLFNKAAALQKQYDAEVEKSKQADYKSLGEIFGGASDRMKLLNESGSASSDGYKQISSARQSFIAIGAKVDDTAAMNQSLVIQLESIPSALVQ